jgi:hypothetical protein
LINERDSIAAVGVVRSQSRKEVCSHYTYRNVSQGVNIAVKGREYVARASQVAIPRVRDSSDVRTKNVSGSAAVLVEWFDFGFDYVISLASAPTEVSLEVSFVVVRLIEWARRSRRIAVADVNGLR